MMGTQTPLRIHDTIVYLPYMKFPWKFEPNVGKYKCKYINIAYMDCMGKGRFRDPPHHLFASLVFFERSEEY